jgi:hypothetical protein
VGVIAARLGTVAIEVDADRPATAAARTASALVRERREGSLVDGRGGHTLAYHRLGGVGGISSGALGSRRPLLFTRELVDHARGLRGSRTPAAA